VLPAHPGQWAQIQLGISNFKSILHNGHDWLAFPVPWHSVSKSYDVNKIRYTNET
jgi:hypothetical protein